MAHVIHSINLTVSGSCHHADAVADEEHHQYAHDLLASASAVLLGRNTFDLFESFWPEAVNRPDLPSYMTDFAADLDAKPKYVMSSRSLDTKWKNTELVRGPELGDVTRLISEAPGTIVVFGSPSLGTSLASAGLVDEFQIAVQPFIGTVGTRAFDGFNTRKDLALLEARPFRSGVVLLRYAR
jgi:dihydrofolate reductase